MFLFKFELEKKIVYKYSSDWIVVRGMEGVVYLHLP